MAAVGRLPAEILQGMLWEEGYQRGELVGEVFAAVPPALARWQAAGVQVGIFSSGSVLAQQLLFRHSSAGDLTPFLRWYAELDAARDAGLATRLSIRRGNGPPPLPHDHPTNRTFDELTSIHFGSA